MSTPYEFSREDFDKDPAITRPEDELQFFIDDPDFEDQCAAVVSFKQKTKFSQIEKELDAEAQRRINPKIEKIAMQSLGETDIATARKRGKEWGEALRQVETIPMTIGEETLEISVEDAKKITKEKVAEEEKFVSKRRAVEEEIAEAERPIREDVAALRRELQQRRNDPALQAAFKVWGRCRDKSQSIGSDGKGFNAGIIHYFQYRTDIAKAGRFKELGKHMSVDDFIQFSQKIGSYLENPRENEEVESAHLLKDAMGQYRQFVLTKGGETVIAFQRVGQTKPRVISVLPGENLTKLEKKVATSLSGGEMAKGQFNALGEGVEQVY